VFRVRPPGEESPIRIEVPFRALCERLEERRARASLYRDLPRGRKRPGWKKKFLRSLARAARELGEVSEKEILRTVRGVRRENRAAEITVAAAR